MVKFLFAKEKMRVRFPLSAQDKIIYLIWFGIGVRDRVVILSLPFSYHLPKSGN